MNRKDPRLRIALQLQRCLVQRSEVPLRERQRTWAGVEEQASLVLRRLSRTQRARRRGWQSAANISEVSAVDALRNLQYTVANAVLHLENRGDPPPVRVSDLYQELDQLEVEFGSITLDPKQQLLAVITDAIELEDIPLGPFRIELHLARLTQRANVSAFDLIALDPNPPDCSDDVTHPHVRDRQLCAGDATVTIARALEQGRISDAFLAVRAVLETYNSGSPYVALSDWHGQPCGDCGVTIDDEHRYTCEQCGQVCCDECIGICDVCGDSYCRSCLDEDTESSRMCCRACRRRCDQCNRVVDSEDFVEETGLCPGCHEEHLNSVEEQETDHEDPIPLNHQPDTGGPADPTPQAGAA